MTRGRRKGMGGSRAARHSRSRPDDRAARARSASHPARPARLGRLALLAGAIVAVAVVAGVWIARRPARPPYAPPGPATPWGQVDPAWNAPTAHARGAELSASGRYLDALPLLHAAAASADAPWFVHFDYATALHKYAALPWNPDVRRDMPRSTYERIGAMKRCLAEFTGAIREAGAAERAEALWARGMVANTWGFSWDARQSFDEAATLDPARAQDARRFARAMADPRGSGELWNW